jgi:hypothetical protein
VRAEEASIRNGRGFLHFSALSQDSPSQGASVNAIETHAAGSSRGAGDVYGGGRPYREKQVSEGPIHIGEYSRLRESPAFEVLNLPRTQHGNEMKPWGVGGNPP